MTLGDIAKVLLTDSINVFTYKGYCWIHWMERTRKPMLDLSDYYCGA